MASFILPGAEDRTVVIGQTGSGKTVLAAWLLSKQNLDNRPWVALDFKNEVLWDQVGDPPMRPLRLGDMPGRSGLYRMRVYPGQEDELEFWLWEIWRRAAAKHKGCGLFIDEVSLVPQKEAFKAILRQGRSLRIPVIACTQRPVDCDREVFSESQYRVLFGVEDRRDWQTIKGLFQTNDFDVTEPLPRHCAYYYDAKQRHCFRLKPCPPPDMIAASIRQTVPYRWWLGW